MCSSDLINLVDGANLLAGALELHLIDSADASEGAVEVLQDRKSVV